MIEAHEREPDQSTWGERLELLSVVRGLEALDQPARVTLITSSRYVRLGLRYGLEEWRRNRWCWEHFGKLVPIKNQDLWQRVDRALHITRCGVVIGGWMPRTAKAGRRGQVRGSVLRRRSYCPG